MSQKDIIKGLKELLGVSVSPAQLKSFTYNEWLSTFRNVPTAKLLGSKAWLQENLPVEAYAAAARWVEIVGNPHRIDKLLQTKLDKEEEEDLMNLAIGDDQEAFYVALVKKTARELNAAATSQEVARLSMNLKIFQGELSAVRSKKAKKGSLIDKIMLASSMTPEPPKNANKRPKTATKKKGSACASASHKKSSSSTKKKPKTSAIQSSKPSVKTSEKKTDTKSSTATEIKSNGAQ